MIILIDRLLKKIQRDWRKTVFLKKINTCGENLSLIGEVYLINTNLKIGRNCTIYPEVQFFGDGEIIIGDNVSIGNGTIIYSSLNGGIEIGNNTMIAGQSYIIDTDHKFEKNILISKQGNISARIKIGDDVWIGSNCTILKGCEVGNHSVIGAKSLVNRNIEENAIAVGIPAKIIKWRV